MARVKSLTHTLYVFRLYNNLMASNVNDCQEFTMVCPHPHPPVAALDPLLELVMGRCDLKYSVIPEKKKKNKQNIFPKSNRNIVERGKFDTPHIHIRPLSTLDLVQSTLQ